MSELCLSLPRLTLDWLNGQPDGCATAVRRILRESIRRSCGDAASGHGWRPGPSTRGAVSPEALELLSVYVMQAHIEDLLARLAVRLGPERTQTLATERCAANLSRPFLDCWKGVIVDLHRLWEEEKSRPATPRDEAAP